MYVGKYKVDKEGRCFFRGGQLLLLWTRRWCKIWVVGAGCPEKLALSVMSSSGLNVRSGGLSFCEQRERMKVDQKDGLSQRREAGTHLCSTG